MPPQAQNQPQRQGVGDLKACYARESSSGEIWSAFLPPGIQLGEIVWDHIQAGLTYDKLQAYEAQLNLRPGCYQMGAVMGIGLELHFTHTMEPLELDENQRQLLITSIRDILSLEGELISLLERIALAETPMATPDKNWFKEAAAKFQEYRSELGRAAVNHDAYLVSHWAGVVAGGATAKYFDYAPSPYPQQGDVEKLLDKLATLSRLVSSELIKRSDPSSIAAAGKALEGFTL